jgi:hypothetical protein
MYPIIGLTLSLWRRKGVKPKGEEGPLANGELSGAGFESKLRAAEYIPCAAGSGSAYVRQSGDVGE